MPPEKKITYAELKSRLKEINHDLDRFDELISQVDEQGRLEQLEQKIDKQ